MRKSFLVALAAPLCLGLMIGVANARQISGTTQSALPKLTMQAVGSDGKRYAGTWSPTGKTTINGRTVYTGMYSVDVPTGKKVLVEIDRVNKNGSTSPMTTAAFFTSKTHKHTAWMINVTPALSGGSDAIAMGLMKVGARPLTKTTVNPLTETDCDEDGDNDYQDQDDDNDGIDDDQDADEDGDGVDDQGEDCDEDGDGVPDDEDDDDQGGDGDGDGQ
ncbi:MAG: hypothetical protein JOZ72_10445 [Alphaproteobacteria bacterium]|nr:hypothetical protein [Alphaproteobacteria bacterium]